MSDLKNRESKRMHLLKPLVTRGGLKIPSPACGMMQKKVLLDTNDPNDTTKNVYKNGVKSKEKAEAGDPYYCSVLCVYFPDENDLGPIATFEKRKNELENEDPNKKKSPNYYKFFMYYETSHSEGPCEYLTDKKLCDTAKYTQICLEGAVSYTLCFKISGGTTSQNKNKPLNWQMFWKIVGVDKREGMAVDQTKVQFEILNCNLLSKPGYKPILTDGQVNLAYDIANENRPLLPVLDHEDEEFEEYKIVQ